MNNTLLIILGVVGVLAIWFIATYNGLITLKNKVEEGWADIETQLKRRYDLIPNMVETVKGYATHESGTLENVTKARNMAMAANSLEEKAQAENMLAGTLKTLFAVAENYPDLKANQNFMDLQQTLRDVEDHLQLARRYFNAVVRDFNTRLQVFPTNMIGGMLGFKDKQFFQVENQTERENVKVSF